MKTEIWLPCIGYEQYYEVSSLGRVRRIDSGRILKPSRIVPFGRFKDEGYLKVTLCKNGKPEYFLVHRLVLEVFHGRCPKGYVANHKDGKKRNNKEANLEWVTVRENNIHALRTGLRIPGAAKGEKCNLSKLNAGMVRDIKNSSLSALELANKYGVTRECIYAIRNGKTWKHIEVEAKKNDKFPIAETLALGLMFAGILTFFSAMTLGVL